MAFALIVGVLVWLALRAVLNWLDAREYLQLWGPDHLDDSHDVMVQERHNAREAERERQSCWDLSAALGSRGRGVP